MYKFSYVQGIAGKAVVVDRELFHQITRNEKVKSICAKIRALTVTLGDTAGDTPSPTPQGEEVKKDVQNQISRLKRQLPAFCWHAWFDDGKRRNYNAHPSGLIMIDVDHVDDPRALFASLPLSTSPNCTKVSGTMAQSPNYTKVSDTMAQPPLLVAHITPSTHGLRLVFPVPVDKNGNPLDLPSAQAYYAETLNLKNVDACTKDFARLSFCVPEEYFLYVDEERLFQPEQQQPQNQPLQSLQPLQPLQPLSPNPFPPKGARGVDTTGSQCQSERVDTTASHCLGEKVDTTGNHCLGEKVDTTGSHCLGERVDTTGNHCLGEKVDTTGSQCQSERVDTTESHCLGEKVDTTGSHCLEGNTERSDSNRGQSPRISDSTITEKCLEGTTSPHDTEVTTPLPPGGGMGMGERGCTYPEFYEFNVGGSITKDTSPLPGGGVRGGVAYTLIVDSLQELLGGIPAHGSRNNFIFSMAAYLRYVCNDDAEWIKAILPTYGETREKWARTIESACQRAQYKAMPNVVKRALELARQKSLPLGGDGEGSEDLPPEMPKKLPRLIQHLVKNVPEVCRPAVANAVFPSLAAHLNGVKFWLIDGTEKEATFMCVTMARQSSGKSAVNKPIEYIVADIVERDEINRKREQEWKEASANKSANKEKPKRPDDLCVQVLVSDMTNAAFVQRMKDANGKYLYTNLEELDLLKQLQTNGTKDVGKIICLCFDNGKYGQERVGTQSVTARVDLRWNWNASSTIQKGIQFFKGRLVDGTLSRVNICTIVPDKSKPFVYGKYDENFGLVLKPYITNLNLAVGTVECKQALALAKKMEENCADEGALSDDDIYQDLAHRAVTIAYLKSMVLYIANDMTWTQDIADFTEWSLRYDLWCKGHFFTDQIREEKSGENVTRKRGRQNLLDLLPDTFTMTDAEQMRQSMGMQADGCRQMVNTWIFRGYVSPDPVTGGYTKTESYLKRSR